MIITTQTAYGFVLLMLSAFVAGIVLSLLYLILGMIPAIAFSCRAVKNGCRAFFESIKIYKGNKLFDFFGDISICLIASCVLCSLVFIFNSGHFRAASVAVMCLGFFLSRLMLSGILKTCVTLIAFSLIKTVIWITFPAVLIIRSFSRIFKRIISNAVTRHKLFVIRKYTREQFDKLEALTEFGLVEQSYKELIK